jgi:Ca2+-binding EF-hand superfamily protein
MNHRNTFLILLATAALVAGVAVAAPATPATASSSAGTAGDRSGRPRLDANGDGAIDRNEAAAHPRLAAQFDTLDKNHDGRLDASEKPAWKGRHGRGGHEGGMQRLIKADTDGDGRLSRSEVAQMSWLAGSFEQIDGNHDGYIVRSELRSYHERMRPQREAERDKRFDERFAAADLNHDGKLSRLEVSEKMPQLSQAFAFMDEDRDGFLTRDDLRHEHR